MSEYDNSNRGALWNNDQKKTEKHPDLSGSMTFSCPHCKCNTDHWISGWKKKPGQSDRAPIVSLSVRPKDYKSSQPAQPTEQAQGQQASNIDDEIPW